MDDLVFREKSRYNGGPPTSPQGPQMSQMGDLVFYEKSRYKIVLWDDLTMRKLGVIPMEGGKRNI